MLTYYHKQNKWAAGRPVLASCAALLCILALIAQLVGAAPCRAGNQVELRLWNVPKKNSDNPVKVAERRVYDAFCLTHPEIRVKVLVPVTIQGPAMEGNEFMAIAGGVAPDVFYLFGRKVGNYRSQHFLYPLNDYLASYQKRHAKPYSGISAPDKVWELCYDRGKVTSVPVSYYSMALRCDKAAFARARIAGRAPRDWDEMYRFARKLTYIPSKEPGARPSDPVQYGMYLETGMNAGWQYLQFVWSGGGEVVQSFLREGETLRVAPVPYADYSSLHIRISNEDQYRARAAAAMEDIRVRHLRSYSMDDLEWRLETNAPASMRAFEYYRKLVHQPWIRNKGHEFDITPEMFAKGKAVDSETGDVFDLSRPKVQSRIYWGVTDAIGQQTGATKLDRVNYAMSIAGVETADRQDPALYDVVPFPSAKGAPPAAFIAGHYLAINASIQPEDKPGRRDIQTVRDAAWTYIEFVTGPQAQKIVIKSLAEYGLAEQVRPSLLEDAGYADLVARIPPERRRLWRDLETSARVEPYCNGFGNVMTRELGMALEAIVNDRPDPRTGRYARRPQRIMDETVRNVNSLILGKMSESEVRRRSVVGWVIFALMAAALIVGVKKVVSLALRAQAGAADNEGFGVGGNAARRKIIAWCFLLPAVATVAIWAYYPIFRGLAMAFQDYKVIGGSSWVGLRNFVEAVSEPKFWRYLLQTLEYTALSIGIGFAIPIALAVLLTEIPRGKVLLRTVYYLPAVTTGMVTLFLWKGLMYDPSNGGVINSLILWFDAWPVPLAAVVKLAMLAAAVLIAGSLIGQAQQEVNTRRERVVCGAGALIIVCCITFWVARCALERCLVSSIWSSFDLATQSFLQDPSLAMLWVVVPVIWASAGPGCLIYLAALKGIPDEQYEAADLDGAGFFHKLANVTYPNLKALIIINLVGAVIAAFRESSNVFVMTGGGPEDATMTTGLYVWYNAFLFLNFGLASAMAWIMGALLVGFTLKQLQILNNIQFRNTNVESEAKGGGK